jgi:hypothetical protein
VTKHASIGLTEWLAATDVDQGIGVSVLAQRPCGRRSSPARRTPRRPGRAIRTAGGSRHGAKLRGSRAEWRCHRLHVLAPHQRSQPVARVSQATMAEKRSGVESPLAPLRRDIVALTRTLWLITSRNGKLSTVRMLALLIAL